MRSRHNNRQHQRSGVNHEQWNKWVNRTSTQFASRQMRNLPQNNGLMTATWYRQMRARRQALRFDHASPNLTPARASPPAMPIGVPSARQQAAPDIVPSS